MSSSRAGISVLLICLFLFFSACLATGSRRFPIAATKRVSPAYYSANHNMAGDEDEEVSDDLLKKLIYEASPEEVSFRHVLHLINAAQEEGRNQAERELSREAFVHPFLRRVAANGED